MKSQPNNLHNTNNPVGRFMVAVGSVIELRKTSKILIVQRNKHQDWQPGEWEISSGRIDQFENPEDGLRRETFEETGIKDLEIIDTLIVRRFLRGSIRIPENDMVVITYWCRVNSPKVILSNEHQNYKWVKPESALKLIKVDGMRNDILKFLDRKAILSKSSRMF